MTGMQRFVFVGSGVVALVYAAFIATVLSANFTPVYDRGVDEAIISTANVIGWTAILAFLHVAFQIALDRIELHEETIGEKAWDVFTTFLPIDHRRRDPRELRARPLLRLARRRPVQRLEKGTGLAELGRGACAGGSSSGRRCRTPVIRGASSIGARRDSLPPRP
ncbi:MAG: hypothetical protein Athens041674_563 [Parcubacteria group bacterium Athens0416_74]|nr:MAG: hypothetical protein Athens041674_563 [Parcubacteria group bacterium Athens0416_74]